MAVVGKCPCNAAPASLKSQHGEAALRRSSPFWRSLWAGFLVGLLTLHWLQHAFGVQFQDTAPKRCFEDGVHLLALARLMGVSHAARNSGDCA